MTETRRERSDRRVRHWHPSGPWIAWWRARHVLNSAERLALLGVPTTTSVTRRICVPRDTPGHRR